MGKQKNIWKRWYMIIGYCIAGFFVLGMIGAIIDNPNPNLNQNTNIYSNNVDNDLIYMDNMMLYMNFFTEMSSVGSDTATGMSLGTININDGVYLFKLQSETWSDWEDNLNDMDVPLKYVSMHKHIVDATKYMKEGTELMSQINSYSDIDLMDRAILKLERASYELQTATDIINAY